VAHGEQPRLLYPVEGRRPRRCGERTSTLGDYLDKWQRQRPDFVHPRTGEPAITALCHLVRSILQTTHQHY
jgi:hypothetical protein